MLLRFLLSQTSLPCYIFSFTALSLLFGISQDNSYLQVMGGTSSIKYMIYVRRNQEDYNNLERMGNTGWSYNDVLPYFLKSEDNRDQDILQAGSKYHETGGYLPVERFANSDPNAEIFFQGYQELGMSKKVLCTMIIS